MGRVRHCNPQRLPNYIQKRCQEAKHNAAHACHGALQQGLRGTTSATTATTLALRHEVKGLCN